MASVRPVQPAPVDQQAGSAGDPLLARTLPGHYRLRGRLRRGAGRPLHLAIDEQDGRLVVVKGGSDREAVLREARLLERLEHPQIVRLHEVVDGGEAAYLVLDYVEGINLEAHLDARGGWIEAPLLLPLLGELMRAVEAVHRAGWLHRDLKPANVLVRPDGSPVLIDLGAALPADATVSPDDNSWLSDGYAAPEQYASDQPEGPWTDVYGLGALAFRALLGTPPPAAPERLQDDRLEADMAPIAEPALHHAINRALALEPADRPPDMAALQALLAATELPLDEAALDEGPPTVRVERVVRRRLAAAPPLAETQAPRSRRRLGRLVLPLVLLLALGLGAAAGMRYGRPLYERHVKTDWLVDPSGAGDASGIADALARAGDGARIVIRPGTYAESLTVDRPVLLAAAVESEPPVIAPLSGPCLRASAIGAAVVGLRLEAPQAAAAESDETGAAAPCLLIAGGNLKVERTTVSGGGGPAIAIEAGASPTLRAVTVAAAAGTGILIAEGARPTIAESAVSEALGAAVVVRSGAAPEIIDTVIDGSGTVLFAEGARGTFARNRVAGARGSAVELASGADPVLSENVIERPAEAGVFIYDQARGRIEGNMVQDSGLSGVVIAAGAQPALVGNIVQGSGEHGILALDQSGGRIEHNTVAGSGGHGIAVAPGAEVELSDNQLQDNTAPELLDARP